MEYVELSLADLLVDSKFDLNNNELLALKLTKELVESFCFLQSIRIYHKDIKPQNILIKENYTPAIIDFGISEYADLDLSRSSTTGARIAQGTPDYMSPELTQAFETRSSTSRIDPLKSDVYSLGLTIYQMITKDDLSKYKGVAGNRNLKFDIYRKIQFGILKNILHAMLDLNPSNRPTFQDILKCFAGEATEVI
ncbi:hypothetical protein SteCoe_27808 [Stentor coeruleus]|uniref:Protein kinase domain-containing protein n=1 Tax=Stentor coeruleus TaxID=5963 RepID=A0A1R2B9W5_9CILI|nr:hypothetical protein SteCoe_27808 [Stentor coeruleus]